MGWESHALTPERFDDFADVVNKSRRASHCWCVTPRLTAGEVRELGDGNREQAMRALCERKNPPGVVTYLDGEPVGWCNTGLRAEITKLAKSTLIPPLDDVAVWSIVCLVVRPGHRGEGVASHLIEGAVDYAKSRGAPAIEAYPTDPSGRMNSTMAYVGTRSMFERAGFTVIGETDAVAGGLPRIVMRKDLRRPS